MRSVSIGPASFHSATWLLSYTWHLISHGSQSMSWRCLLQLHHTDDSKAYFIAYWRYYKPSPVRSAFENSANEMPLFSLDMEKISSDHSKNSFHSRVPISISIFHHPLTSHQSRTSRPLMKKEYLSFTESIRNIRPNPHSRPDPFAPLRLPHPPYRSPSILPSPPTAQSPRRRPLLPPTSSLLSSSPPRRRIVVVIGDRVRNGGSPLQEP